MANIYDYLEWRGDLSFAQDPFGEVDNVILSILAYTDFDGLVPGIGSQERMGIKELSEAYFSLHASKSILSRDAFMKEAPFLLPKLAASKRFGGMNLGGYVNLISESAQEQMSSVSCFLDDGTVYVSFRGTDNTIVGWREDFNLAYMKATKGQIHAAGYLDAYHRETTERIRVGGHSKGGNFAVYAAAFCDANIRSRIIEVFSNDGPGFLKEIVETDQYRATAEKVISLIPSGSLFGLLLDGGYSRKIIVSDGKGIYQHDARTWQVTGNHFLEAKGLSEGSQFMEKTIAQWLEGLETEEREEFIETVFSALEAPGSDTFAQINEDRIKNYGEIFKYITRLDKEKRSAVLGVLGSLAKSGRDRLMEKLPPIFPQDKEQEGTTAIQEEGAAATQEEGAISKQGESKISTQGETADIRY